MILMCVLRMCSSPTSRQYPPFVVPGTSLRAKSRRRRGRSRRSADPGRHRCRAWSRRRRHGHCLDQRLRCEDVHDANTSPGKATGSGSASPANALIERLFVRSFDHTVALSIVRIAVAATSAPPSTRRAIHLARFSWYTWSAPKTATYWAARRSRSLSPSPGTDTAPAEHPRARCRRSLPRRGDRRQVAATCRSERVALVPGEDVRKQAAVHEIGEGEVDQPVVAMKDRGLPRDRSSAAQDASSPPASTMPKTWRGPTNRRASRSCSARASAPCLRSVLRSATEACAVLA